MSTFHKTRSNYPTPEQLEAARRNLDTSVGNLTLTHDTVMGSCFIALNMPNGDTWVIGNLSPVGPYQPLTEREQYEKYLRYYTA